MKRGIGKRILSLVLAVELFCSPLAVARAEDPAQLREEIPLGEEVRPVRNTADDLPVADPDPVYDIRVDTDIADADPAGDDAADADPVDNGAVDDSAADDRTDRDDVAADDPADDVGTDDKTFGDNDVSGDDDALRDEESASPVIPVSGGGSIFDLPGLGPAALSAVDLTTIGRDGSKGLHHLGLSFGLPDKENDGIISCYDAQLRQESPMSEGYQTIWGYGGGTSKTAVNTKSISLAKDGYLYFFLPDMGRVPDLELEGLYLYNGAVNTGTLPYASWIDKDSVLRSWSYDESHPENYKKLELESVGRYDASDTVMENARTTLRLIKPTTIAGVTYDLVRFPAWQVEEDLSFVYHLPEDPDGPSEQWSIPIVARWVPSKDSDLALFALDITRSDTGATETVTDLYTKPFRQAGAADHLTAAHWQASYFTQLEEDLANDNYTNYIDVTHTATAFTPDPTDEAEDHTQHYYLRVEEEQDSVTLRFLTREPNYKYHMIENGGGATEPVTVTAAFTGKTDGTVYQSVDLTAQWDDDGQPILPQALKYGTSWIAQNNTGLPARGQWTAVNIPLQKVSQAADPDTDPFNTVTITVTAPDGESQSVYVFHIERLMTPETSLGHGNTPAGMIMRDTSARWASAQVQWGEAAADLDPTADLAAYNKASAIKFFGRNQTFQDMPITPAGAINQSGAIYKGHYSNLAWQGSSLDLEPAAVVAYQDMAFDDPGVSFVDSEGHRVVFGDGALSEYEGCVTRTLELRCVTDALTVDSYAAAGLRCWYNVRADGTPYLELDQTKATQTLRRADGSDPVDLRGLLVLPGTYKAVYTFTDPVSGDVLTAQRAVVVLPIPGDVDMDGAVTAADAAALDTNAATWVGDTTGVYPLLRNRVYGMDLGNNSGKLTAATIRTGFQPVRGDTEALGYSDYMYLPLPYTGDNGYHARKTWAQVTDLNGNEAKLRLDFLGIEQGTWNKVSGETYTNHISGPWASPETNGDNPGVSIVSGNPNTGTGDVFWMGVYVEDAGGMAGRPIKDLSISLVYDSEYVRPAVVHAAGAGLAYGDNATCWQVTTLLQYNLLAGSQGNTIFSGYNANHYTYTNSTPDRPYATHYSKVEGELELAYTDVYGHLNSSKLKEAVFSLQSHSSDMATMQEGYLLVLPFQLIRHPDERMKSGNQAQLVELAAGMRDFSIVLDTGTATYSQGIFELFSAQPRTAAGATYAFSAQDDIYGNTTQNIRQTVTYDYANDLVPIGKDNTQRIELEATYDTSVRFTDNAFYTHNIEGALPPGMTHAYSDTYIEGTPTKVGVYDFTVEGQPYRITVKPKDIQYRAVAYSTYYGEREFRGTSTSDDRAAGQRDFTFEYRRADLSERDRAAAAAIYSGWTAEGWGTGDELKAILTRTEEQEAGVEYTAPAFYATPDRVNKQPVNYKTNVGKYEILTEHQPTSTNYTLTYSTSGDSGLLTIEARPVWIDHLTISQTRSKSSIYNDQTGTGLTLNVTEQEGEELIALTFDDSIRDGEGNCRIDGRPLTGPARVDGDIFGLSYAADYVQNEDDLAYVESQGDQAIYRFLLNQNEEQRSLRVTAVGNHFIGVGNAVSNYSLRGRASIHEPDAIVGTVVRRGVEAITFAKYPSILQAKSDGTPLVQSYYGDKVIDPESLHVIVTRGAGDGVVHVGEYEYNNPSLRPMEIHYNWVSPQDMAKGLASEGTLVGAGWDPSLPEGQQDLHPYNGTDPLTPDMDGYYLCAAVKKYETALASDGEARYIKVYSTYPVRVSKRTLTLTARPSTRYYGEPNGHLSYTYNYQNLIPEEVNELREWVRAQTGNPTAEPTGTGEEMEGFFRAYHSEGFVAPTLEASKSYKSASVSDDNKVDETTSVGGGEFYIILKGAASSYYDFVYTRPREVNGALTSQTENSTEYGFSKLTMLKRPIVISDVYSTDEEDPKANFETVYADTKNLFLQNQTAEMDRLTFTLPESDSRATYFYRYGTSGDRIALALTYNDPNGPAVVNGDDVRIRYSVRFMCDPGHSVWMGFDNNYYDVATISAEGGTMQKDVVVADMELRGNAAVNYELVYTTSEQAAQRAPSNVARKTYPNPNHNGDNTIYLVHGTGAVTLRKITSMTLESVGQVSYTYGDGYAPYANNAVSGTPMKLTLHYETAEDERHNNGDYDQNVHVESLTFQMRQGVSNFTQRGLTIYYLKPGQTTQEAVEQDQILDNAVPMIPDEHNGAQIFVTGKRREEDPTVTSRVSEDRLQVVKRALTFTVRDAHRFYGETLHVNDGDVLTDDYIGTTDFTYAFPTSQLAQRDREALAQLKGVAVSALPDLSTEADLKLLGYEPEVTYTADPGVDAVVNKESWGEYPIGITTHDLAGYKVTGMPGTLYVYPRPIGVDDVKTSAEDPVYTIYNQSSSKQFIVQLDTEKVEMSRTNYSVNSVTGQPVDSLVSSRYCSDDVLRAMPLSGDALVGDDVLAFTVLLYFYDENGNTWNLEAGAPDYAQPQVNITFREVRATDTSKNYAVSNVSLVPSATFTRDGFWGAVKLRTIDEIFITGMPKTQYTYGETLDLYGLQVTIRYKALQGMGEVNRVDYLGPDSFKQVGLYVNYWYPEDTVPGGRKPNSTELGEKDDTTTTYAEDELRKALPNTYRRADTGDHVTIAPTHDTQQYIGSTSTNPLERPFAANGKYLIVSAFQEGDKQTAATPKILGAAVDNTSVGTAYERENAPIPIVVAPRQLRYDLAAADKTYDGTTRAAGTLTLTNLFDANTQVKVEESAGMISSISERIRDVVYIPVGAAYEGQGDNASAPGYDAYRSVLRNGAISFTTGRYQANGAAPLKENGTLAWSAGYEWGKGLTFTFANPNVHYLEAGESGPRAIGTEALADYWRTSQAANDVKDQWDRYGEICAMPVEVTGMVLAGPDAANYTWAVDGTAQSETEVSMTTRSAAEDGRASAPYATIHKANRATIQSLAGLDLALPRLQLDEHTNVIRLLYDQDLTALADNNNAGDTADEFRDELHFEYALYYEGEDGLMIQWAGPQGDRAYQDTTFFGGELVRAETALGGADVDTQAYQDTIFFGGGFDQSVTASDNGSGGDGAYRGTIFFGGDFSRAGDDGTEDHGTGKGQRYRWTEEDTGLSALGYREDGGVVRDLTAGADCQLYAWGSEGAPRAALPRDTVFYPLVRLSETHNYHASGNLTGDADVTAQMLDTAQRTRSRLTGAEGEEALLTDALAASAEVFSAAQPMKAAALELSAQRVAYDAALADQWASYDDVMTGTGQLPAEGRPLMGSASAVKTFLQRLDLISTNREPVASWGEEEVQEPLAQALEDVWFTDTVAYPQRANLDAVVYNSPLRYHYYYWDVDKSSRVDFADETYRVDLDTAITVPIRQAQSDGSLTDLFYTYDPYATNHTARIYVQLAHIHAWGQWEVTVPATCLEEGVESRICAECAEVEHRAIPSLGGHAWGEWEVTVPATCLEEGAERHTCAVCGATEDRAIPSLGGHTWSQWIVTTPPTCTGDGVETRACAVCGQTETRSLEKTGHHYGADGVCPDCGEQKPVSGGNRGSGGGTVLRKLRIVPQLVFARLGDEPYMLNVSTGNVRPGDLHYTWTSSDPSVVTVSKYGVLTFRGEGVAIITVRNGDGWEATATVVVSAPLLASQTALLFNFYYSAAWAWLDDDYAFRPQEGMTREELVTLLDVFLNPSDQWQATQELAYVDVTGREKYYDALRRLTGAGVVVGIPGETFAGDQLATRAEFVTMLSRMLQLDIVDTTGMAHTFADADEVSTWAYAYIDALAKTGVIRGVGGGAFAPDRVITREETAAIIARLLTVKLDLTRTDLLRPSDMTPENWSYPAVLQAINTVIFPD